MRFLVRDATREELRAACVDNHLVWLRRLTEASGGQVRTGGRVMRATTVLILPDSRVRGPGLERFEWITRFCLDLGCRYLVANALERAVPLYKNDEFQRTRPRADVVGHDRDTAAEAGDLDGTPGGGDRLG